MFGAAKQKKTAVFEFLVGPTVVLRSSKKFKSSRFINTHNFSQAAVAEVVSQFDLHGLVSAVAIQEVDSDYSVLWDYGAKKGVFVVFSRRVFNRRVWRKQKPTGVCDERLFQGISKASEM